MSHEQLDLLSSADDKLARQWRQSRQDHPEVFARIVEIARELQRRGHTHYSIDGIFHILRWETGLTTGDLGLKVNNNHTAPAARDVMREHPDLAGFFRTRARKPRANFGQFH